MFLSKKPYTFQIDIFTNAFKFILFVPLLNEKFRYNKSYNCWYIQLWVYFFVNQDTVKILIDIHNKELKFALFFPSIIGEL